MMRPVGNTLFPLVQSKKLANNIQGDSFDISYPVFSSKPKNLLFVTLCVCVCVMMFFFHFISTILIEQWNLFFSTADVLVDAELTEYDIRLLLTAATLKTYKKGDIILEQGDINKNLYRFRNEFLSSCIWNEFWECHWY
jgi:hypothetical protein